MKKERSPASPTVDVLPEWAPQKTMWTAFPSAADLWLDNLALAQKEVAAMAKALANGGIVKLLAMGDAAISQAKALAAHPNISIVPAQFGDIWLRDTGPVFAQENGKKIALGFGFNGWGGKYQLPHDESVAGFIAEKSAAPLRRHDFILEGGAVEFDGAGKLLTTKECLLNKNRNPHMTQADIEAALKKAFGVTDILWLEKGLMNDHTDGHIDNIARFIAPGHALCQSPNGADDPNAKTLDDIARQLEKAGLKVSRIPSPGLITDEDGKPVAASHMNYIIFNKIIVLPIYDVAKGAKAAEALGKLFPDRQIIALPARHVLTGGGSFHCITQQEF